MLKNVFQSQIAILSTEQYSLLIHLKKKLFVNLVLQCTSLNHHIAYFFHQVTVSSIQLSKIHSTPSKQKINYNSLIYSIRDSYFPQ